jgi:hypothetical protein
LVVVLLLLLAELAGGAEGPAPSVLLRVNG